jgi:hypothetical protein
METTDVSCPICLNSPEDPVNLCSEKGHEMTCKECIGAWYQMSDVHVVFRIIHTLSRTPHTVAYFPLLILHLLSPLHTVAPHTYFPLPPLHTHLPSPHLHTIAAYVTSTVSSAFLGSCPNIFCPSTSHVHNKKRRIIPYNDWKSAVPNETNRRYNELANSLLAFLCGGKMMRVYRNTTCTPDI